MISAKNAFKTIILYANSKLLTSEKQFATRRVLAGVADMDIEGATIGELDSSF